MLLSLHLDSAAQTELKSMFYNLLNYPSVDPGSREDTLKKIIDFHPVDLLMVCELKSELGAQKILDNVLNADGGDTFARAAYVPQQSNPSSDWKLQQTIFYNQEKLHLVNQYELITPRRDINVYEMWMENDLDSDTTWLDVYVTHFKSSQGSSNEQLRYAAAQEFTDHIETRPANHNVIFAGDLNLYDADESAYLELLDAANNTIIEDPIDTFGPWHANDTYDFLHTQSTRNNPIFDDGAGGGMDDRFDFILCSSAIMNAEKGLKYNTGSYAALGNNRECFDQSILLCQDEGLPMEVLRALYHMSDHLPIVANFETSTFISGIEQTNAGAMFEVINPSSERIQFYLDATTTSAMQLSIADLSGKIHLQSNLQIESGRHFYELENDLADGLYILQLQNQQNGQRISQVLLKNTK